MLDEKVHCMQVAKQYEQAYWDGERRYGYGGYRYKPGHWKPVAEGLIREYQLTEKSNVSNSQACKRSSLIHNSAR